MLYIYSCLGSRRPFLLVTVGWVIWKNLNVLEVYHFRWRWAGSCVDRDPSWRWGCIAWTGIGSPCCCTELRCLGIKNDDILRGLVVSWTALARAFSASIFFNAFSGPKKLPFLLSYDSFTKSFIPGLILPQAIFLHSILIAWEVLPTCTKALCSNWTICSSDGFPSVQTTGRLGGPWPQAAAPGSYIWSLRVGLSLLGELVFYMLIQLRNLQRVTLRLRKICQDGLAFFIIYAFIKMFIKETEP